jgi:hypothetical protein
MATNSVENILSGAKATLAKANKLTESVEGNPTTPGFTPKKTAAPKVPQAHQAPSYSMARQKREPNVVDELNAKAGNIKQYNDATKEQ